MFLNNAKKWQEELGKWRTMVLIFCILFSARGTEAFAQLTAEIHSDILNNEWTSSWITCPNITGEEFGVYLFRKDIAIESVPKKFIVHASADNRYKLYVNGIQVCNGPARGDFKTWYFETIDLAPYLKMGLNVISAEVWNFAKFLPDAQITSLTGFILQGNTLNEEIVNTNTSWSVHKDLAYTENGALFHIVGPGEVFNCENHPWNWMQSGFDSSGWNKAQELEKGKPLNSLGVWGGLARHTLYPRTIPAMEEKMQRFDCVRRSDLPNLTESFLKGQGSLNIPSNTKTKILIDQKILTTAYPVINFSKGKNSTLKITYSEGLYNVKQEKGNRNEIEDKSINGNSDLITADGGDNRTYKTLWWRTFRFVELEIETKEEPLIINDFHSIFTGYPFVEKASFACNDTLMKTIWDVSWRTQRLCAFETFMDCPYYEQLQYVGDARIQAFTSTYMSVDSRLVRNAIASLNDSRLPCGLTQSRYPSNQPQMIPPFTLVWNTMVYDYWMLNGDTEFVRSMIPGMMSGLNWFESRMGKDGMLGKMEYWNFVDWADFKGWNCGIPPVENGGHSSILSLQYVYTLQMTATLFNAFGLKEEASRYITLAERIKTAVYKNCWDQTKGLVADTPDKTIFSQHANALAILTNTIPEKLHKDVANNILNNKDMAACTLYFRFYLTEAIAKAGLADQYPDMLDPWKKMLGYGLTTFAEVLDPTRSDCHAWSASPIYFYLSLICGIQPGEPGFKTVKIEPNLGRLNWIEGSMPNPLGTIKVSLKKEAGHYLTGLVTLPENLSGTFVWNGKKRTLKSGLNTIKVKFAPGQPKLTRPDLSKLPDAIKYEGIVTDSIGWLDSAGKHIVLTTETGIYESNKFKHENEGLDAEIFAYHYLVKDDSAKLIWEIHDFIQDCPVDIEASFIKNTLQVTDLNKDGVAEVWLMYKTACHGDVSPCDMKIILFQGQKKQVVSGLNKIQISENLTDGGNYTFDKSFNKGPQVFRDFAMKLWKENLEENFNE